MTHPVVITDETFKAEVYDSEIPVLVDFWAEWCSPCRMVAPVVEQLATELHDQMKVAKFDIDSNPLMPDTLGIRSIPTLILFKGGVPVERLVGFMPRERLLSQITPHLED